METTSTSAGLGVVGGNEQAGGTAWPWCFSFGSLNFFWDILTTVTRLTVTLTVTLEKSKI